MSLELVVCSAATVAAALIGWSAGSATAVTSNPLLLPQETPDCDPECE